MVEFIDVKYIVNSGADRMLRPHLVTPHTDVSRSTRREAKPDVVAPLDAEPLAVAAKPRKKRHTTTIPQRKKKPEKKRRKPFVAAHTVSSSELPPVAIVTIENDIASLADESLGSPATSKQLSYGKVSTSVPSTFTKQKLHDVAKDCPSVDVKESCGTHKLEQVYHAEIREAGEFVEQLRGGDRHHAPPVIDEEMDRFTSDLNVVLLEHEGMLQVEDLPELLPSYPRDVVFSHVDRLCAQNKIMRTDGFIYNI